jgi:hypothetical protein
MKFLIILLFSFSAFADVSLEEAYRREKAFLAAQKESLLKMKATMSASLLARKNRAQADINAKQAELSQLGLRNQELHEEYKAIEKMTKESFQMSGQLDKNYLKINENLQVVRAKLGLPQTKITESDTVKKFESILKETMNVIGVLGGGSWRSHAFLDENEHLIQGEVYFQGLFAAWGKYGDKIFALAPYNNEFLKVVSSVSDGETYLFTPDFAKSNFKASKTWKEAIADAIPGIVMLIIMAAVLGLFILLARA